MRHPSSLSPSAIRANLTRCRKALVKARIALDKRVEEVDLTCRVQAPPAWLLQRLKENETKVWFYETRIREYEEWLDILGEHYPIVTP